MCEHLGEHREIVNDDDVNDLIAVNDLIDVIVVKRARLFSWPEAIMSSQSAPCAECSVKCAIRMSSAGFQWHHY